MLRQPRPRTPADQVRVDICHGFCAARQENTRLCAKPRAPHPGGNAVDAAVATLLALSVVEPFNSSVFGAGFMLIHLPDGQSVALDNYAVAPRAAHAAMYEPLPPIAGTFNTVDRINEVGHLAVGVPGSLAAYGQAVERYGRLPWATLCSPAIRLAAEGFPATPFLVEVVTAEAAALARFPETARVFLPGGQIPAVGSLICRSDYAETLRLIAAQGPDALYKGAIGAAVVTEMERHGGLITMQDLAEYRVAERTPVRGAYWGYEIISMAPASAARVAGGMHAIRYRDGLLEGAACWRADGVAIGMSGGQAFLG